jgi:hypothetical protein
MLVSIQRGRRVKRATSCALKRSSQAGKRSLTHGDRLTAFDGAAVGARAYKREFSEFINDLHVWFRSFRIKLSRMRVVCSGNNENSRAVSLPILRNPPFEARVLPPEVARHKGMRQIRFFLEPSLLSPMSQAEYPLLLIN